MQIRRARPQDTAHIAEIERETFGDPFSPRDIDAYIVSEGSMCYIAEDDSGVIAYMIGRKIAPEGEIYRIATRRDKRRRGIAYRLLDFAVKTERGRGVEAIFLEVREGNIPARNLYTAYGFRQIGERAGYYQNPPDNAVIMLYGRAAFANG